MPAIQCTSCSLWFASELGFKIHYSKMHASVVESNRKQKAKSNNNNNNEYLNNNMLFELCDTFGESGEEENELRETNVKNVEKDKNGLEFITPENRRNKINGKMNNQCLI